MSLLKTISAVSALDRVEAGDHRFIDVRSSGEFAQGAVPGFINAPILTDSERHQVGITYKNQGQDAAIALGHRLVDPVREERVRGWQAIAREAALPPIVTCWRGGLRSQIACDWLGTSGVPALRIEGGYKAMRQELLKVLATPLPIRLLAGLTGSGKTRLLGALPIRDKIDLEALAHHRGSSFGAVADHPQPSQATFENALAMALRGCRGPVLVEDESVVIGSLHVPLLLRQMMEVAPVIYVETPLDERIHNIFDEYVARPLRAGRDPGALRDSLLASISKLARRLGGALASDIAHATVAAFSGDGLDGERHRPWIAMLLTEYYDQGYIYAFARRKREVVFRGSYEECRQWILRQYA